MLQAIVAKPQVSRRAGRSTVSLAMPLPRTEPYMSMDRCRLPMGYTMLEWNQLSHCFVLDQGDAMKYDTEYDVQCLKHHTTATQAAT